MTNDEMFTMLEELSPLRVLLDRVQTAGLGWEGAVWIWPKAFAPGFQNWMGMPVFRAEVLQPKLGLAP